MQCSSQVLSVEPFRRLRADQDDGAGSNGCVQVTCWRPRAMRFRITDTNPIPISKRLTAPGSGVGVTTCVTVKEPPPTARFCVGTNRCTLQPRTTVPPHSPQAHKPAQRIV